MDLPDVGEVRGEVDDKSPAKEGCAGEGNHGDGMGYRLYF